MYPKILPEVRGGAQRAEGSVDSFDSVKLEASVKQFDSVKVEIFSYYLRSIIPMVPKRRSTNLLAIQFKRSAPHP